MGIPTTKIVELANHLYTKYQTRNPRELADALGVIIMPPRPFKSQKGAYKVILNNRFIFFKEDMNPVLENIVLLHELGHDQLHRDTASGIWNTKMISCDMTNNGCYLYVFNPDPAASAWSGCDQ
ncbi:MAG: hypothetical protein LUH20_07330 [Lachnospiraceae bacterium]|nr:hypothetical protein [Lachnospiraceae bacterium]